MSSFLISYDISHPKRLLRVHRFLKGIALPIQYSVFLFHGNESEVQKCISKITSIINPKEDDVRCYPLPKTGLQLCLGKATLPRDIYYSGQPEGEINR